MRHRHESAFHNFSAKVRVDTDQDRFHRTYINFVIHSTIVYLVLWT